jgi:hypothetical protein
MAESNGHRDFASRLDRAEAIVEKLAIGQQRMVDEQKFLVNSHILLSGTVDKLAGAVAQLSVTVEKIGTKLVEIEDKLNGVIALVETDHREFHARLTRIEERRQ